MDLVIKNHYLHRKCSCIESFGLFDKSKDGSDLVDQGKLVGVIVLGKPASYTLCNGICGKEYSKNVVEFNRLWVCDSMPKNTESFFVAKALSMSDFEIIVSFADREQGHVGYIYQATNWLYTGISPRMRYFRPKIESSDNGGVLYSRRKRMTRANIVKDFGEQFIDEYWSSEKHRYIFFNAPKKRRKKLMSFLKYPILKYPKF